MSELPLVLDVAVSPGNQMSAKHALPGLESVLDRIPARDRPRRVRGDAGFGNEATLVVCESREVDYLFRLRQSSNVKKLIARLHFKDGGSPADCGYEAYESTLKLVGWTKERRVVVLRRRIGGKDGVIAIASEAAQQLSFLDEADNPIKRYEHVVLVTSLGREGYELRTIAQLYRDRGDCENGFDGPRPVASLGLPRRPPREIKNPWGWTGFTSQEIKRSTLMARHIALIYNGWSLFVRAAHPKARREAITSRPLLLNAVGRKTEHAGSDESDHYLTARSQECCLRDAHQRACASQSYQGNYVAVDASRAMASLRQVHHRANHGVQPPKPSHLSADG